MLRTGQRDFADGTGVMGLEKGEDPGLLGGPNVITESLKVGTLSQLSQKREGETQNLGGI